MTRSQVLIFTVLGILFWFSAAMVIRLVGDTVFSDGNPYLLPFYLLAIPITGVFIVVTRLVTKVKYAELLKPAVLMTIVATIMDSLALAWYRQLYSESMEVALHGAAWILWGVALGLLMAWLMERFAKA